ncbi:GEVED domain-containing protein [Photobacterium damselae]|uniref:GEVED domain-containing protein n=1 Tax=Photobacterium damselae TaxID=38293 RepID=UPI0040692AB2
MSYRSLPYILYTGLVFLPLSVPFPSHSAEGVGLVFQSTLLDIGGNGGGEFGERLCPSGLLMTGFDFYNSNTGGNLDGRALRGQCSQATVSGGTATLTRAGETPWGGPVSGTLYSGSCPANQAVVGVDAQTTTWPVMGWFRLYCAPVAFNTTTNKLEIGAAPGGPSTGRIGPNFGYGGTYYNRVVAPAGQALGGFNGRSGAALDKVRFRAYSFVQASITLNASVISGSALPTDFTLIATDSNSIPAVFSHGDTKAMTPSNYTFTWTGPADYELVSFSCADPLSVTNGNSYNCTYTFRSTKVDYGDAPISYGGLTTASHGFGNSAIYLGSVEPDFEDDRFTNGIDNSLNATDDDSEGTTPNDEEALVPGFIVLNSSANATLYSLAIPCNDFDGSDLGATVYAWIDTDRNNSFDNDEFASASCNDTSATLNGNAILSWSNLDISTVSGMSYIRLRITTSSLSASDQLTNAADGEIEDHQFELINQITLRGTVFEDNSGNGSGIAHNGIIDGNEQGIGNATVEVVLNDTGVTGYNLGDVITSRKTSGNGRYTFILPVEFSGKNLIIRVRPVTTLIDISESDLSATPQASSTSVTDSEININAQAGDDIDGLNFGKVREPIMEPNHYVEIIPNQTITLNHQFKSYTDGNVTFSLVDTETIPAQPQWSAILYQDLNCDQLINSNEVRITAPLTVTESSQICLISKIFSPANIFNQSKFSYKIQADVNFDDPATTNHNISRRLYNTDTIKAIYGGSGQLELNKTVQNLTQNGTIATANTAKPGDILEYRIIFTNVGNADISDPQIFDSIPKHTRAQTAISCGGNVPTSLSCNVSTPDGTNNAGYLGNIYWSFTGALASGASGTVSYRVVID